MILTPQNLKFEKSARSFEVWVFFLLCSCCFNLDCISKWSNLLFLARWKQSRKLTKIWKFWGQKSWTNEVSKICSGSFLDTAGVSKTSKNMILERFKLPENQKNYENLKNSKLAEKTSRYEGRSAESNTLSLFNLYFLFLFVQSDS